MLEVIAQSLEDALEAEAGGADRLEVVRDLDRDGLTPPIELVESIAARVSIPARVMLRDRADFLSGDSKALERLRRTAAELAHLPIDGLVIGFVRGSAVDVEAVRETLADAGDTPVTFHRAIEAISPPESAIPAIREIPNIDRILISGGTGDLETQARRLEAFQTKAGPSLKIIAGGGTSAELVARLRAGGVVQEFHIGRAARVEGRIDRPVRAELVRAFRTESGLA